MPSNHANVEGTPRRSFLSNFSILFRIWLSPKTINVPNSPVRPFRLGDSLFLIGLSLPLFVLCLVVVLIAHTILAQIAPAVLSICFTSHVSCGQYLSSQPASGLLFSILASAILSIVLAIALSPVIGRLDAIAFGIALAAALGSQGDSTLIIVQKVLPTIWSAVPLAVVTFGASVAALMSGAASGVLLAPVAERLSSGLSKISYIVAPERERTSVVSGIDSNKPLFRERVAEHVVKIVCGSIGSVTGALAGVISAITIFETNWVPAPSVLAYALGVASSLFLGSVLGEVFAAGSGTAVIKAGQKGGSWRIEVVTLVISGILLISCVLFLTMLAIFGVIVLATTDPVALVIFVITFAFSSGVLHGESANWTVSVIYSIALTLAGLSSASYSRNMFDVIEIGGICFAAFWICYLIGSTRLFFYPLGVISVARAYGAARAEQNSVYKYLRRSSLYWLDDTVLPLPFVRELLLLAAEADPVQVQEDVRFTCLYRPREARASYPAAAASILHQLNSVQLAREMAEASELLKSMIELYRGILPENYLSPFLHLWHASEDARRYLTSATLRERIQALRDLDKRLDSIDSSNAKSQYLDRDVRGGIAHIVLRWKVIANQALAVMQDYLRVQGKIPNPYTPGLALELQDSLFVGRRDITQQLESALGAARRRPALLLRGERRMGKTSAIKQLPQLLEDQHISVMFDLQAPGMCSSTFNFLSTVATRASTALSNFGVPFVPIDLTRLQDAQRQNEASLYLVFDEWMDSVDQKLESVGRTLLLVFDEFEKLEEASDRQYIDLPHLLSWFRFTIQNRKQIALMFSGIHAFSELKPLWPAHFVNVQVIPVSFLRPVEARKLIVQPTPDFPGEQMFGGGLPEQIIRLTGGQPFLIQAICSAIVETVNREKRFAAQQRDLSIALDVVFERWAAYFQDLWERTDADQRVCLKCLAAYPNMDVDIEFIAVTLKIDNVKVRRTIETLARRDLVIVSGERCRITIPALELWIKSNN